MVYFFVEDLVIELPFHVTAEASVSAKVASLAPTATHPIVFAPETLGLLKLPVVFVAATTDEFAPAPYAIAILVIPIYPSQKE